MTVLAQIPKNSREEIRVSRDEFNGHDLINLRVYYKADDGVMRPGKQGLAFKVEILPDILDALSKAGSQDG
ncbi:MAG: transcriptional coactivator p15/PC4 family protein [Rhodobacteraceae bacterium]|nr:transcriptional coactivator p15/PC4 family protein [Paracoccaceae bacterium]